jgi:hypothetical protein
MGVWRLLLFIQASTIVAGGVFGSKYPQLTAFAPKGAVELSNMIQSSKSIFLSSKININFLTPIVSIPITFVLIDVLHALCSTHHPLTIQWFATKAIGVI